MLLQCKCSYPTCSELSFASSEDMLCKRTFNLPKMRKQGRFLKANAESV